MACVSLTVLFCGAPHSALPLLKTTAQPALDKSFQVITLGGGMGEEEA